MTDRMMDRLISGLAALIWAVTLITTTVVSAIYWPIESCRVRKWAPVQTTAFYVVEDIAAAHHDCIWWRSDGIVDILWDCR